MKKLTPLKSKIPQGAPVEVKTKQGTFYGIFELYKSSTTVILDAIVPVNMEDNIFIENNLPYPLVTSAIEDVVKVNKIETIEEVTKYLQCLAVLSKYNYSHYYGTDGNDVPETPVSGYN